MHINHRTGRTAKQSKKAWPRPYSIKEEKQRLSRLYRRDLRQQIKAGDFISIVRKVQHHIIWDWW